MACHPPHKPKETSFAADSSAETCKACHYVIYDAWNKSPSRHHAVNCTECHTKHGFVPECLSCHEPPHEPAMLARFPSCLGCHLDPHDPPVKRTRK